MATTQELLGLNPWSQFPANGERFNVQSEYEEWLLTFVEAALLEPTAHYVRDTIRRQGTVLIGHFHVANTSLGFRVRVDETGHMVLQQTTYYANLGGLIRPTYAYITSYLRAVRMRGELLDQEEFKAWANGNNLDAYNIWRERL